MELKQNTARISIPSESCLFFINLGGYQEFKFEEQHYYVITVKPDKTSAIKKAKDTQFFKNSGLNKAPSHVYDKYGIDVDDIYLIEDILISSHKSKYKVILTPDAYAKEDAIHLGYMLI